MPARAIMPPAAERETDPIAQLDQLRFGELGMELLPHGIVCIVRAPHDGVGISERQPLAVRVLLRAVVRQELVELRRAKLRAMLGSTGNRIGEVLS